jgi:23S rRNA (cytosine1962-C5)-methyltransferase
MGKKEAKTNAIRILETMKIPYEARTYECDDFVDAAQIADKLGLDHAGMYKTITTVGMVTWAKENAVSSGLGDAPIRWLVDDCVKFVEREIRRGNHYDAIIMDPPSYGRGPKGEIWKIEESVYPLVQLCAKLLTDKPLFFLINSYTTGLQPAVLTYMISTALKKYDGKVTASEIGLPVSSNGLVLPCGASGRFEGAAN